VASVQLPLGSAPAPEWAAKDGSDLLDRVVHSVLHVGLSVQAAAGLDAETAGERLTDALQRLDDTVHDIRDHIFGHHDPGNPPE
jgi:hypothetical protein